MTEIDFESLRMSDAPIIKNSTYNTRGRRWEPYVSLSIPQNWANKTANNFYLPDLFCAISDIIFKNTLDYATIDRTLKDHTLDIKVVSKSQRGSTEDCIESATYLFSHSNDKDTTIIVCPGASETLLTRIKEKLIEAYDIKQEQIPKGNKVEAFLKTNLDKEVKLKYFIKPDGKQLILTNILPLNCIFLLYSAQPFVIGFKKDLNEKVKQQMEFLINYLGTYQTKDFNIFEIYRTVNNIIEELELFKVNKEAIITEFLQSTKEVQIKNLTTSAESYKREYESYMEKAKEKYRLYQEKNLAKELLKTEINKEEIKQLIKILSNDTVKYIDFQTANRALRIELCAPIVYYERDYLLKRLEQTTISTIERSLLKILRDNKYQLYTKSSIYLHLNSSMVSASTTFITTIAAYRNPHLTRYNCWGNNGPLIRQALIENRYVDAIAQTFAACSNLNLTDAAVMRVIVSDIMTNPNCKSFKEKETGKLVSFQEIIKEMDDE